MMNNYQLRKIINKCTRTIVLFLIFSFFLAPTIAIAESVDELQRQKEAYAAQAQAAREKAKNKSSEANYLQNQLSSLTYQISEAEYSLAITNNQISETQKKIDELNTQIKAKENDLEVEKKKLHDVISSWYMEGDSTSIVNNVLGADSLSEMITKQEYYDSIKQQIQLTMEELDRLKAELQTQKAEQDQQMLELKKKQEVAEAQKVALENQQWTKRRLLTDTKDMISELKVQEASASQKVAQLQAQIDQLSATKIWGGDILSSNDSSWYESQLWYTGVYLGPSDYTVAQYGCLITSLTMVAKYYGRNYSVPSAVNASSFNQSGMLLYTPIVSDGGSQAINWGVVDSELGSGHPVVVGVDLPEITISGNLFGVDHFIVLKPYSKNGDNYYMHDPLGAGRGYSRSQVKAMRIVR